MPFMLYNKTPRADYNDYTFIQNIKIAGNTGPLAKIQSRLNIDKSKESQWHASDEDVLREIGLTPENHAIIIDLKPNVKGIVSLYKLLDVWGYSYPAWTPIAVRLEEFFSDREESDPSEFKKTFSDKEAEHNLLGEFLYLQGGTNGGSWNWGMVGRVNGALLWPSALKFLAGEILKTVL
jgi:hypothetical protein